MKNKLAYLAAIVILVVYIAFGITIAAGIYTNGFESFRSLYVVYDGTVVKNGGHVETEKEYITFKLKNAGFAANKWGDYTIAITSNPDYECIYTANAVKYGFEELDFSDVIQTRKIDGGFILRSTGTLQAALEMRYNAAIKIEEREEGDLPFRVTITAESGKNVSFLLGFEPAPATENE